MSRAGNENMQNIPGGICESVWPDAMLATSTPRLEIDSKRL